MSGMYVFGAIVVCGVILLGIVMVLADRTSGKSVRRKEYDAMKAQADLAAKAIDAIFEACEEYKEIDHPVTSKLKPLISDYYKEERKLRR
jgi:hypothetical protein